MLSEDKDLRSEDKDLRSEGQGLERQGLEVRGQGLEVRGQGLSSRQQHWVTATNNLLNHHQSATLKLLLPTSTIISLTQSDHRIYPVSAYSTYLRPLTPSTTTF